MFHIILRLTMILGVGLGLGFGLGADRATAQGLAGSSTSDWQPEPQTPTGKFTTATEVKPILTATKSAWLALREYDGKDLLYFTQLLAWRCGLHEIQFAVNGAAPQLLEIEACHTDTAQPNAMKMDSHLPYLSYDLGSVNHVTVTVIYDDASTDSAEFSRKDILMP